MPDYLHQASDNERQIKDVERKLSGVNRKTTCAEVDELGNAYDEADALKQWHINRANREFSGKSRSKRLLEVARATITRFLWRQ